MRKVKKTVTGSFRRCIAGVGIIALSFLSMPSEAVYAYQDGENTYEWKTEIGKQYWYENGVKQGIYGSKGNVFYDDTERGREIYDRESDGWYWLDAVFEGAKAENKEVFMPYIYSDEAGKLDDEAWIDSVARLSNKTAETVKEEGGEIVDLSAQIKAAIKSHGGDGAGKWVRYDAKGKMVKGWYKVQGSDEKLYPDQAGNVYYYDRQTGLMAKGDVTIDGIKYSFDEQSGALTSGNAPDIAEKSTDTEYITDKDRTTDSDDGTEKSVTVKGITRLDNGKYHIFKGAKEISDDIKIGDVVKFGSYEQDNNISNGKEAIEWEVLDIKDGKALLVSRYVLDNVIYNTEIKSYIEVSWADSNLRTWMNDFFYNTAFDTNEKGKIVKTTIENAKNPKYGKTDEKDTEDNIFALSYDEIRKYYGFNTWFEEYLYGFSQQLVIDASPYAKAVNGGKLQTNEISKDSLYDNYYNIYWGYDEDCIGNTGASFWLRTKGDTMLRACGVDEYGHTGACISWAYIQDESIGVRPALYIQL